MADVPPASCLLPLCCQGGAARFQTRNDLPFFPLYRAGETPNLAKEEEMKVRVIAAAGLVFAFVAPALAADAKRVRGSGGRTTSR